VSFFEGFEAGRIPAVMSRILREPLLHFLVLAGLLFVGHRFLAPPEREVIRIDRAAIDALVQQHTEIRGRPLTGEEQSAVVESFVDDQVLLREAYRQGLDQDAVVHRHLIQKMRFVLGEDPPEPTDEQLRAFLDANAERYRSPPTLTLEQVYFADPRDVPNDLLERLRRGDLQADGLGDRLFMLGNRLSRYSFQDLEDLLGVELAERLFDLPVGVWQGSFRSPHGVHFVRVVEHHPQRLPAFETIRDYLAQDWILAWQRETVAAELETLRGHYEIVVEGEERAATTPADRAER
jgi:hypothetical protein